MQNNLLLIDGNSLFFKAFYGTVKRLESGYERGKDGKPVNAIRSFAKMIMSLKKKFPNHYFLIAFDAKGTKTYRNEYSFYKAGRKKTPEELYEQIIPSRVFLDLYGIKWTENKFFEADDIIGIVSKQAQREGFHVDIITSDKDLLQLVDKEIDVYLSIKGVQTFDIHNLKNFYAKNGVKNPSQITDLKGIMGDSSDNLPGIKGIGKIGALKLINEYESLENIIKNSDKLPAQVGKKVRDRKELSLICKNIATIIIEANTTFTLEDLKPTEPQRKKLITFLEKQNIYNIAKEFREA
ncbi:MAG: hypothetical protein GQ557_02820 [Mycoplasmataceae bacterium]|nr:hypothetical protein [Mycoplasmataceae bacterium]